MITDHNHETINGAYVASLCAADWGLWRTCKLNIERTRDAVERYGFSPEERSLLSRRVDALWEMIAAQPKSRRWKLRDRIGDRTRWYDEPDEVG